MLRAQDGENGIVRARGRREPLVYRREQPEVGAQGRPRELDRGDRLHDLTRIDEVLRYLEQLNVSLVREALTERALLLGVIAPHLVRPMPFLLPLYDSGPYRPAVVQAMAEICLDISREFAERLTTSSAGR